MNADFIFLRNLTIFFATAMVLKYYIFLMLAPFHSVKEALRVRRLEKTASKHGHAPYRPMVSVIIPAWNEEVGILKTIRSILNNTYSNFEVIVVNDGSTDNSDAVIRNFLSLHHFNTTLHPRTRIRYFHQDNGGKGTALNRGINESKGQIVMTVDADSALDPEAIEKLVAYFEDPNIDAAVGNVKVAKNRSIVGFIQTLEYMFGFYFKRTHSVLNAEYIYGGACAAFRKNKTFEQLGLFDEANKTEDIEMSLRTRYHGLHSVYAEDVICYTEGASSVRGLINQRLRWKKGRFDTLVRYRQMFFSLQKRHNRFLCWFILPYCLLSEAQLLFEPFGITLLLSYSIISGDYLSLTMGLLFIFAIYLVNALFNHEKINVIVLLLFPLTWPLFYFLVWIEWVALLKSIRMIVRGDEIVWQQWERRGVEVAA